VEGDYAGGFIWRVGAGTARSSMRGRICRRLGGQRSERGSPAFASFFFKITDTYNRTISAIFNNICFSQNSNYRKFLDLVEPN